MYPKPGPGRGHGNSGGFAGAPRQEAAHHPARDRAVARARADLLGGPVHRFHLCLRRLLVRRSASCSAALACSRSATSSSSMPAASPVPDRCTSTWPAACTPGSACSSAGVYFLGMLFLGAGGVYVGLGFLIKGFFNEHLSLGSALLPLRHRRPPDRARPEPLRRAARRPRRALPGGLLDHPARHPRDHDHLQGRRGREHPPRLQLLGRRLERAGVQGHPDRGHALHRVRGGRRHRRGDSQPASVGADRRALDRGHRDGLLRPHGLRRHDRLRERCHRQGRRRRRPGRARHPRQALRRLVPARLDRPGGDHRCALALGGVHRVGDARRVRARPRRAPAPLPRHHLEPRHAARRQPRVVRVLGRLPGVGLARPLRRRLRPARHAGRLPDPLAGRLVHDRADLRVPRARGVRARSSAASLSRNGGGSYP